MDPATTATFYHYVNLRVCVKCDPSASNSIVTRVCSKTSMHAPSSSRDRSRRGRGEILTILDTNTTQGVTPKYGVST